MSETKGAPDSPLATQPADPPRPRAEDTPTVAVNDAGTIAGAGSIVVHRPQEKATFSASDVLAERYRILRFVAAGGMGEVYEAEDLTLGVSLALKTIKPEIARDPLAVERFKREINVARRITHPNVSRIYDVGVDRREGDPTMFLTMQFLSGENLKDLITRKGRLTEDEALPLAEQIAAGLAAAHDEGIIHRDFKSANVMLVQAIPTGSTTPRMKAVITDFGLARPEVSEKGLMTLSESGVISGTPAYMAPEQVEGRRLTPAADLYAFGIVLYEMVTGRRPFEGDSPMAVAVKRLTDDPAPPRNHAPGLSDAWNAAILRCLERDPARRFASATDVARALREAPPAPDDSASVTLRVPSPPARPAPRRPFVLAALLLAIVGAIGAVVFLRPRSSAPVVPAADAGTVSLRNAVAVLPLRNNSGRADAAWLSTAIAEMMASELAAGGRIRVAAGHDVARMLTDLGVRDGRELTLAETQRIKQSLGVDSLVAGSYTLVGDAPSALLRLDVRLVDATTGKTIRSHDATGSDRQLFDLVSRAGGVLRQPLGGGTLTPADELQVQASLPADADAARLYTEGVRRLREYDAKGAIERLVAAAEIDPKHPFIRHALSSAYSALGNDAAAEKESERAVALSQSLSREQKLLIEARFHVIRNAWDRAIEIERTLREMFPDSVEYGIGLADSQISAGRTREALTTIQELRRLPKPASQDARIDLVEALAHQAVGDSARQRDLARAAAAKARASGARAVVARARLIEANALMALGELDAADQAAGEAQSLYAATGDESSVASCIEVTAAVVQGRGDLESAQKLHEQVHATYERIGNRVAAAQSLIRVGAVMISRGRSDTARPLLDRALAALVEAGAKDAAAVALNDLGAILFYRGDLDAARSRYMEAFRLLAGLGDQNGQAAVLTNVGEILAERGDLEEARKMHTEALTMNRAVRNRAAEAYDLYRLGEVSAARGDTAAARARYAEALKIQEQSDRIAAADTQIALARLAIDEGHAAEAEKSLRSAEQILRTQGATERAVVALAALADAQRAQGRHAEALRTAEQAWQGAQEAADGRVRFAAAISLARARASSNQASDIAAAIAFLEQRRSEAAKTQFVSSELQTRLALAQIELAAGRAEGKKRLASVAADAKKRGFTALAARASS